MKLRLLALLGLFYDIFFVIPKDSESFLEGIDIFFMMCRGAFLTVFSGHIPCYSLQLIPSDADEINSPEFTMHLIPLKERVRILKMRQWEKMVGEGAQTTGYLPDYLRACIRHLERCPKCIDTLFDTFWDLKSFKRLLG